MLLLSMLGGFLIVILVYLARNPTYSFSGHELPVEISSVKDYSVNAYAKFSEKLKLLT